MRHPPSRSRLRAALIAALLLPTACHDSNPISPDRMGPLFHISDGSSGGNSEFFFLTPLAPGPEPHAIGESNPHLRPFVRVCETGMGPGGTTLPGYDSPAGCVTDVTQAVTGSGSGLEMTYDAGKGIYQIDWSTKDLDTNKHYRIEVWGLELGMGDRQDVLDYDERWLFGWRDITQSPSVASCNQDPTQAFCRINYGQTLPVKARIQQFVFCPELRNCSLQFIAAGQDASLAALFGGDSFAALSIPGQGGTDFALAFEPCSGAENAMVDGAIDLPTSGDCVKTVPQPGTGLLENAPAVISFCSAGPGSPDATDQFNHRVLHHFGTAGDPNVISSVEAWPHAVSCPGAGNSGFGFLDSGDPDRGLLRFAHSLGERVLAWAAPRRLVASSSAAALDVGIGGQGFDLRSFWKAAVPGKFEYVTSGDHSQTHPAGSEVALEARVVDLLGNPLAGATVRWRVESSPSDGASIAPEIVETTGPDGIAKATATLSGDEGFNVFHAWGKGIANAPDPEHPEATPLDTCPLVGSPQLAGDCNGPRGEEFFYGPFDPFMPLFHPHMDDLDGLDPASYDVTPVTLAQGFLEFQIFGCLPGKGTPTVDGQLGAGEWDCAKTRTFPVNLSGGSKVNATLYWMNDDQSFYIAVAVPGIDRRTSLRVEWHRNAAGPASVGSEGFFTGTRTLGSDVWEIHPDDSPVLRDMFIDSQCSGSSGTACGQLDSAWGGFGRTTGGSSNQNGMTIYEMAHPLASGDTCNGGSAGSRGCHGYTGLIDLAASPGDTRGFFLSLRMGSGAQGSTVWPGFLKYLAVEIR